MTLKSPFNAHSPVLLVELSQAGHIHNDFGFRRVAARVIFLGRANDQVDDGGKAAAATAALAHGVVHLRGNDQLPAILVEELHDRIPDFFIAYVITTANEHLAKPAKYDIQHPLFAKEENECQERIKPALQLFGSSYSDVECRAFDSLCKGQQVLRPALIEISAWCLCRRRDDMPTSLPIDHVFAGEGGAVRLFTQKPDGSIFFLQCGDNT
jgi:hypothetical protein